MDKNSEIRLALKGLQDAPAVQVWPALVKSVEGTTCTVDILGTDLVDVAEVNLRADDEASEGVLLKPRVGSYVFIGVIENEMSNLYVCQVSEVDQVQAVIEGVTVDLTKDGATFKKGDVEMTLTDGVTIKKGDVEMTLKDGATIKKGDVQLSLTDGATIKQAQTEMTLKNGKVTVKNAGVNLKDLFSGLTTLLKTFQVVCGPAGSPSAAVFPATLTSIVQVETKVNQLLQ
jgi:hypothetical protein